MQNKKFVRIHSTINIQVTAGLQYIDATNKDAHIPDRLNVKPNWTSSKIMLKQGSNLYPAKIAEWATVKALAEKKLITIGEFTDGDGNADVDLAEAMAKTLEKAETAAKKRAEDNKLTKAKSLAAIADINEGN